MDVPTLYLFDGNAAVHRAYHALPPLTNSQGEPVGALYGFARLLHKILKEEAPPYVAVCFDTPAPTFRHQAFPDYKGHRKAIDEDLKKQLPLARELSQAWGLATFAQEGFEADDLIATLTRWAGEQGWKTVILTTDKDAFQLVSPQVTVRQESARLLFTPEAVAQKFGVSPKQMMDFLALVGDASDNVPGVAGVGEKTAVKLLAAYGSLDGLYQHLEEVPPPLRDKLERGRSSAFLSRDLVRLNDQVPFTLTREILAPREPGEAWRELLRRFEFTSLLKPEEVLTVSSPPRVTLSVTSLDSAEAWAALVHSGVSAKELCVGVWFEGDRFFQYPVTGVGLRNGGLWLAPGEPCPPELHAALAQVLGGSALKIVHDLKATLQGLERLNLSLAPPYLDLMLASYCLNPAKTSHTLLALAAEGQENPSTPAEELECMAHLATSYKTAFIDSDLDHLLKEIEQPLSLILSAMEKTGIALDVPYLKELNRAWDEELNLLRKELHALAGREFNLNSPKQMAEVLFQDLKLTPQRRTKTGVSTDEETLKKLALVHPLPARIMDYRELSKLKSTYAEGLLKAVSPQGRVHTRFNQAVAATGRLSSSDPNLQNIPIRSERGRRIRRAFVPSPGCVFLSADYSQIDLRVLAHLSQDPALMEDFRQGRDVHAATARDLFGLPGDSPVGDDQRRVAKTVNFGIVYGQTAYGLSQQLGVGVEEAQGFIRRIFQRYPGVAEWMKTLLETARRDGYVSTLLKRRRPLPDLKATNQNLRSFAERAAINTPVQGTSADIIKVAMLKVSGLLKTERARMLVQVHDDLLFDMPLEDLPRLVGPLRHAMESAVSLSVPLVVDVKSGVNWNEMSICKGF